MQAEPVANERGSDICLEIGERQDEVGAQGKDLVDVRRGEGTDPRLLPAGLRRTNDIAGNPDDAVLLAKQIERLDSLFGEADNSCRWRHVRSRA